jgi:hypothetical protein
LDLAQLITSSSLLNTIPPPGVSCICPGKLAWLKLLSPAGGIILESELSEVIDII